jgi:hypothetical protein
MPINFPSSPADGQLYAVDNTTYYYDAAYNVWLTSLVAPQENKALSNSANTANAGYTHANAAFDKANSANVLAYNTGIAANNYAGVMANSANAYAASLTPDLSPAFNKANDAFTSANQAGTVANNANTYGNSTYVKKAGDTITGDLTIQGNITTSGVVTYANTQTLLIGDSLITLNNDIPIGVAPSEDAGIEVKRGSSANVALLWNEGSDRWTFTNDGTNYRSIASNTDVESANNYAGVMANSANAYAASLTPDLSPAFNKANGAYTVANAAFDKANNSGVNVSTTGPTNNTSGTLWFNSNLGRLFVYYTDVDSSQWIEASPSSGYIDAGLIQSYVNVAADLAVLSYNQSNTAFNRVNVVFGVTNTAFGIGNAAFNTANSAFNTANSRLANTDIVITGNVTSTQGIADRVGDVRNMPIVNSSGSYTISLADNGEVVAIQSGNVFVTANVFFPGNTVSIYNNSSANVTITQNTGVTLQWVGLSNTGNRILQQRGLATLVCVAANTFILTGAGFVA